MQGEFNFDLPHDGFEPYRDWTPNAPAVPDSYVPRFVVPDPYCPFCGIDRTNRATQKDHKLAKDNGGDDSPGNLHYPCADCNSTKYTHELRDWCSERMRQHDRKIRALFQDQADDINHFVSAQVKEFSGDSKLPVLQIVQLTNTVLSISDRDRKQVARELTAMICLSAYVNPPSSIRVFFPTFFISEFDLPNWFIDFCIRNLVFSRLVREFCQSETSNLAGFWMKRFLVFEKDLVKNFWMPVWLWSKHVFTDHPCIPMSVIPKFLRSQIRLERDRTESDLAHDLWFASWNDKGTAYFCPAFEDDDDGWIGILFPEWHARPIHIIGGDPLGYSKVFFVPKDQVQ